MRDLVVDTDVVSFGFRGDSRFQFYDGVLQGNRAIVSFMTLAELLRWSIARNWSQQRQKQLLAHLRQDYVIHPATRRLCHHWAELTNDAKQQGRVLHSNDAWIAATAKGLNVPLVTHNARDFNYLPGLQVIATP